MNSNLVASIDVAAEKFQDALTQLCRDYCTSLIQSIAHDGLEEFDKKRPRTSARGASLGRAKRTGKTHKFLIRSPEALNVLGGRFLTYVKAHPGQRIMDINKVLGCTTKELALPVAKLLADKKIVKKGTRSGTTYYPGK